MINTQSDDSSPIEPEVLPPHASRRHKMFVYIPKLAILAGIGTTTILVTSTMRSLFPIICLGFLTGFVIKKSRR